MPREQQNRQDVYSRVTNQIIEAIEKGVETWEMPWHSTETAFHYPVNIATGNRYRGVNVISLWTASYLSGYPEGIWGTFKQWSDLGHSVRKGERASIGVFWKQLDSSDEENQSEHATQGRRVLASAFPLFNAAQIEGYVPPERPVTPVAERIEHAESFFSAIDADVRHGGGRAYYHQRNDYIQMPPFEVFADPISYYSTRAHETTHWSGHPSRLNRDLSGRFGDEKYAAEELIAELGAAFVCADLELTAEPRPENAAYVHSWLGILKNDNRAIFTAAKYAQQAADFMHQSSNLELTGSATLGSQPDGLHPAP